MMRRPTERLADQDRAFTWYYRVQGTAQGGSVTTSELVHADADLEAAHERVMATEGTVMAETLGPFRGSRA